MSLNTRTALVIGCAAVGTLAALVAVPAVSGGRDWVGAIAGAVVMGCFVGLYLACNHRLEDAE